METSDPESVSAISADDNQKSEVILPDEATIEKDRAEFLEHAQKCDELGLYLLIEALAAAQGTINADMRGDKIDKTHLETLADVAAISASYTDALRIAKLQTPRFGVSKNEEEFGEHFEAWFLWWNRYVTAIRGFGDGSWENVMELINAGEDTSAIRPDGDWKPDPNAYRDGSIPASWLCIKLDRQATDAQMRSTIFKKEWKEFFDNLRGDDELWSFANDEAQTEGYVAVLRRRPTTPIIYTKRPDVRR